MNVTRSIGVLGVLGVALGSVLSVGCSSDAASRDDAGDAASPVDAASPADAAGANDATPTSDAAPASDGSTDDATSPTTSLLDGPSKIGVYLSGNADTSSTYSNSKMGALYLPFASAIPVTSLKTRLANGESLHLTFNVKGQSYSYINGLNASESTALSALNARVGELVTLATYAKSLNNGTYVVSNLLSEAQGQTQLGDVPGVNDDANAPTTIGKAEQIFVRAIKQANNPNLFASLWIMGFDVTWEQTQAAQITNPKPDIITWDPYETTSAPARYPRLRPVE